MTTRAPPSGLRVLQGGSDSRLAKITHVSDASQRPQHKHAPLPPQLRPRVVCNGRAP
ncbi:protein of unknown function [Rhodovastum atsumiense]|nr:protein of unknown function [Rhodovastum atsumiense]